MEIVKRVMNSESLKEKMNRLKRKMEVLESREDDITEELKYAESLSLKKPKKVVQTWLKHVGIIKTDVQQIEQQVQESGWGISNFTLPMDVDRLANEATELFQNGNFAGGLTLEAYGSRGVSLLTRHLVGGEFEKNKNDICQWLQSNEGSNVGVYGMGGVGKTTLLTHIHNQLQNLPDTSVSWVTVSQSFSIFELQNRIAKTVGLKLSNGVEERKRAAELAHALRMKMTTSGQNILVLILDDVWEYISADKVGIPIGANGFKLILSTRSSMVCERMNCQRTIKVQPLSPEEAWELFLETLVLETSLAPQIEEIAKSLVRNCDGLPLGIVTMAGCMKGVDDICDWRNALERMEESKAAQEDMETEVFRVLRYSYDNLKDKTVQHCFLYCSLFPEDHEIDRDVLIEYLIDERLIDGRKNRQERFDRGHTILNKLENVCLLERGEYRNNNRRYVKMHDLIRDMAIQLTSVSPRFLVKAGVGLEDIPEDEMWSEDLVRVSLMSNYGLSLPSNASPRWPRLSTLLLIETGIERIPDCFFMHMNKLTVLDLSESGDIKSLPSSISNLRSLTALLLRGCENLKYVPSLENLTALRRLDISDTRIAEVPQGIEMLVNLEYLKLFNDILKVRANELPRSRKLYTFTGHFNDTVELNTYVSSWEDRGLNSYLLVSGDYRCAGIQDYDGFKRNVLCGRGNSLVGEGGFIERNERNVYFDDGRNSLVLPKDIQWLEIRNCDEVTCLCDASLENLEVCRIYWCKGMTHVFCSSCCPFLRKLYPFDPPNFNDLMEGGTSIISTPSNCIFHSLKEFYMSKCPNMKRLFMPALLSHLQKLEIFKVEDCEQMEEIIGEASHEDEDQEATRITVLNNLPMLRSLTLRRLPELKNFCSTSIVRSNSLKEIVVFGCPKLRRMPWSLHFQNLEILKVEDCKQMEEIIGEASEEDKDQEARRITVLNNLPMLRSLTLRKLPELKNFCSTSIVRSNSLKEIAVVGCPKLRRMPLLSHLQKLEILKVEDCEQMEEIIGEASHEDEDQEVRRITVLNNLPMLRSLTLQRLPELKNFCSTSIVRSNSLEVIEVVGCPKLRRMPLLSHLQNLKMLKVQDCLQMEEIIGEASDEDEDQEATRITVLNNLPKLKHLTFIQLPELMNFCSTSIGRSNSLEVIEVVGCPKLRRMPLLCEELNPLPSLLTIYAEEEWWESLQWDHSQTKDLCQRLCQFLRLFG